MEARKGAGDYVGIRKALGGYSLGELEAQIMDVVWDLTPPTTARSVFRVIFQRRGLAYSTIMLTMSKLARKGILRQETSGPKKSDPFVYTPVYTREQIAIALLRAVAETILRQPLHLAIAKLCDAGDISCVDLRKLEALSV